MIYPKNRVFGLDVLRAFAILCVVYPHGYHLIDQSISSEIYNIPTFDGVTMFFVLSGFLIGRILLRTLAKDDFSGKMLAEFWVRRWFRTLPNYMLVLMLLVIANHFMGLSQPENITNYFFFSQNVAKPHPGFFPEAWSLAVEEWFYLIIPIPLYLSTIVLKNVNRRGIVLIWIAVVIVSVTAFRFYRAYRYGYSTVDEWDLNLRKQVITRLDSLMFGVFGAYISIYMSDIWRAFANKGFFVGIFLLIFNKAFWFFSHSIFYLNYFNLTVTTVGTLLLMPKLSAMKRDDGWVVRIVTFISLTSYSMYLLNLTPVQGVILPVVMRNLTAVQILGQHMYVTQYIAYWIVTITGSFLLYRYFERPMTAMRDKFYARSHSAVTAFTKLELKSSSKT